MAENNQQPKVRNNSGQTTELKHSYVPPTTKYPPMPQPHVPNQGPKTEDD